jgi:preprotein translocase subunit SecG
MSSTYGGSSVVEKNLDRITIVVGGIWFATIIALGLVLK